MYNWMQKQFAKHRAKHEKGEAGFTLVELIVVIAILGILGGVGTVGYTGYIKSSQKNADKALVGNIVRAIEIGTYSTMFTPSNSMKISATTFPVGFISLSTEGTTLLTSGTNVSTVDDKCEIVTLSNVYTATKENHTIECEKKDTFLTWCSTKKTDTLCTVSGPANVTYCKTHSTISILENQTKTYNTSFSKLSHSGHTYTATPTTITGNILEVESDGKLYGASSNSSMCEYAYANQNGIFTGENIVNGTHGNPIDVNHPLYNALYAAYGDLGALTLQYDGWASDEGIDYATFYTGAPGVMSSMESLSGLLAWASTSSLFNGLVDGQYEDGEEVLSAVTDKVLATHTEDSWLGVWNDAGNTTWDSYGFGLSGRENYSAARIAYNNGFASYLTAKNIDESYVNVIKNFNSTEIMGLGLPGLVCTDAFTDADSPLKGKFKNAGDRNAGEEGSVFNQVASLFEEYKTSQACEENGRVFYDTMVTFDETEEFATDKNNIYGGDMFDYYNAYVNEIASLYNAAQESAGDGILIVVNVENGEVKCDVSPAAANPRND